MKKSEVILAQVQSASLALNSDKLFSYEIPSGDEAKTGEIYKIEFGKKQTLGIIRAIEKNAKMPKYKIKQLGKKIDLPSPLPSYFLELADWLQAYYSCSSRAVWSCLLPSGIKSKSQLKEKTAKKPKLKPLNKLSSDQSRALEVIKNNTTTLLHGITGSGKTEVYLHAIYRAQKNNESTILLVPEIMLTSQLENKLRDHFSDVVVLHSGLSTALRKKLWLESLEKSATQPLIILGPRSALFTPLHNLGLIIIDEEHEPSYKQESAPRYEAQIVAGRISQLTKAKLILGSATPSLRSYNLAKSKKIGYAELLNRHNSVLPSTSIIDMKNEKKLLSTSLEKAIDNALEKNQQVLLFLNRRGSASALLCNNCSKVVNCPNCEISLTYHADTGRLVCHYCNHQSSPSAVCTFCGSTDLRFVGDGTKKLELEVSQKWPNARIKRVDRDNSDWQYLKSTYAQSQAGEIDILIGTQMISRGLDIENLTVVGIVDADSALQIPDFSASERTFQLISQAAGRAGRRATLGTVIIQTRNPTSGPIVAAAANSYNDFYNSEMKYRKDFAYPPYVYLVKLEYADKSTAKSERMAGELRTQLVKLRGVTVLGPTMRTRKSLSRESVAQIIVKSSIRSALINICKQLPAGWVADLDPIQLL